MKQQFGTPVSPAETCWSSKLVTCIHQTLFISQLDFRDTGCREEMPFAEMESSCIDTDQLPKNSNSKHTVRADQ